MEEYDYKMTAESNGKIYTMRYFKTLNDAQTDMTELMSNQSFIDEIGHEVKCTIYKRTKGTELPMRVETAFPEIKNSNEAVTPNRPIVRIHDSDGYNS